MKFMLPDGTPWIVSIAFWAMLILVGLLFGGFMFWVKRYIDSNDAHHKKVEGKLTEQSDEFDELAQKLDQGVKKIDQATVEMAKTQASFQSTVSQELVKIHEITGGIKNDLTEGRGQVALIKKDLEQLAATVVEHRKSLDLGTKAMTEQREDLLRMKTVVVKINDDLKIIKQKMVKKEDT